MPIVLAELLRLRLEARLRALVRPHGRSGPRAQGEARAVGAFEKRLTGDPQARAPCGARRRWTSALSCDIVASPRPRSLHPPVNLLIRNARILTLATGARPRRGKELGELSIILRGDVLVADGTIAALGPRVEAPADSEVIDANGRVLMPGFVDCHTHACWAGSGLDDWEKRLRGVPQGEIVKNGGGLHATVLAVREATKNSSPQGSGNASSGCSAREPRPWR